MEMKRKAPLLPSRFQPASIQVERAAVGPHAAHLVPLPVLCAHAQATGLATVEADVILRDLRQAHDAAVDEFALAAEVPKVQHRTGCDGGRVQTEGLLPAFVEAAAFARTCAGRAALNSHDPHAGLGRGAIRRSCRYASASRRTPFANPTGSAAPMSSAPSRIWPTCSSTATVLRMGSPRLAIVVSGAVSTCTRAPSRTMRKRSLRPSTPATREVSASIRKHR